MNINSCLGHTEQKLCDYVARARDWLRAQRQQYSIHDGVWTLLSTWPKVKERLSSKWQKGIHVFQSQKRYTFGDQSLLVFDAEDALLLKTLSLALTPRLTPNLSKRVYNIKGRGGIKAALRDTQSALPGYTYVFKSDIRHFYASIAHEVLLSACREFKMRPNELSLLKASLERVEEKDMRYTVYEKGIAKGSPLSPLLGTIVLDKLDLAMEAIPGVYYARYMDDWVVLCKTRNQLRTIIKITHRILKTLQLELHPDKTYLGRIAKGFDFLGHRLNPEPTKAMAPADTTLAQFRTNYQQRYAQGASAACLDEYVRRFTRWCRAGLDEFFTDLDSLFAYIARALNNMPGASGVWAESLHLDKKAKRLPAYQSSTILTSKEIYHDYNSFHCESIG